MVGKSERRGMASLLFEVWENREDNGLEIEMSPVSRRNDDLREKITPKAILLHAFRATSDFEALQLRNDLMGWGTWRPEPDWSERHFTDEEAREQELYLLVRNRR
jgi:hypothetical protein